MAKSSLKLGFKLFALDGHYFLNQLPLKYFINLMKEDELKVDWESQVLEWVEKYIRHRSAIPYDKNEEEKLKEAQERALQGLPPLPNLEEEERKTKEVQFNALDDTGKIQWRKNEEVNLLRKEADERMRIKGLRPSEKREIFKTIRYAFISHAELLKCSRDPLFHEAKEYLVEGLTYKIDPGEVFGKDETIISLKPRLHYLVEDEYDRLKIKRPQFHKLDDSGYPVQEETKRGYEVKGSQGKLPNYRSKLMSNQARQNQPLTSRNNGYEYYDNKTSDFERNWLGSPQRPLASSRADNAFLRRNQFGEEDANIVPPLKFGVDQSKSRKIVPQTSRTVKSSSITSFDYSFDFDENGIFYFLGTEGGKKIWQNPHTIGQVQAFASSIGFGSIHELVGRKWANIRTLNEPFSFFGVDLGEGRKILPSCYTIMNRNSSTHVLMNWHFEGSNDKLNWTILDRRVYMPDQLDPTGVNHDYVEEEIIDSLCLKQGTNTWGIDSSVYQDIDEDGFRFFRIIQISPNSSGSDNLALSCFELYGKIVIGRFP